MEQFLDARAVNMGVDRFSFLTNGHGHRHPGDSSGVKLNVGVGGMT